MNFSLAMARELQLSICIPTYNRANFLDKALACITAQWTESVEIVIADNASDDDTPGVLTKWQARFPERIRSVRNPSNLGFDRNILVAAAHARGAYCWFMSDDDTLAPKTISAVLAHLAQYIEPHLLLLNYARFDTQTDECTSASMISIGSRRFLDADSFFFCKTPHAYFDVLGMNLIFLSITIFPRAFWQSHAEACAPHIGTNFLHTFVFTRMMICERLTITFMAAPLVRYRAGNIRDWATDIWQDFHMRFLPYARTLGLNRTRIFFLQTRFILERARAYLRVALAKTFQTKTKKDATGDSKNAAVRPCTICGRSMRLFLSDMYDDRYGAPERCELWRCRNCHAIRTLPPVSAQDAAQWYKQYYPQRSPAKNTVRQMRKDDTIQQDDQYKNNRRASRMRAWLTGAHRIEDRLPSGKGRILDIGCGNGASLLQLRALGYDPFGVDIDEQLRETARTSSVPMHIGAIEDAPFAPHSFDSILANQLLEHIVDFQSFFNRANELLAPDGVLIFSTPNADSVFRKIFQKKWINWHLPFHRMLFTQRSLTKLSAQHGFRIEKIQTITPTAWIVHQLHALRFTPRLGERNPYWCEPTARASFFERLFWLIVKIICTPINRCIDLFHAGDCIIVTMRRRAL